MADAYYILHLQDSPEAARLKGQSFRWLRRQGLFPDRTMYNVIYKGAFPTCSGRRSRMLLSDPVALDSIYEAFREGPPEGYPGDGLDISDIIALNRGGEVTFYYVDLFGFQALPNFWERPGKQ